MIVLLRKGGRSTFLVSMVLVMLLFGVIVVDAAISGESSIVVNSILIAENDSANTSFDNATLLQVSPIINETFSVPPSIVNNSFVDVSAIARVHGRKLSEETEAYLRNVADASEEREYIVKFTSSIGHGLLENVTFGREFARFGVVEVRGNAKNIVRLLVESDVEFVELDQSINMLSDGVPWGVGRVNTSGAWNLSTGAGVKVAILDTGIAGHDDLSVAGGVSVVGGSFVDSHGHGTAVAGVVAALKDGEGLVGVAPNVSLYAVKVMEDETGSLSDVIAGVEWSVDSGMDIVSMSFGLSSHSQIFKEVIGEAYDQGLLLVAAAGNTGGSVLYPAAYVDVVAVGAMDEGDVRASFSSYGYELELVAPGVNINTTGLGNGYVVQEGTSFAAPHVAGVAALIWAYNASLSNVQVRGKLRNDALDLGSPGKDDEYGYGLVQVNLNMTNFTFVNESYFYEVFNITGFGTENESLTFWLNGTGTVDDVNFTEGYYETRKHIDPDIITDRVRVDENGTIYLLAVNVVIVDAFTSDGTFTSDGEGWKDGVGGDASGNMYIAPESTSSEDDGYCMDDTNDGSWDFCKYNKTADLQDCKDYSQGLSGDGTVFYDLCTNSPGLCSQDAGLDGTRLIDDSLIHSETVKIRWYKNCDTPLAWASSSDTKTYWVFDQRKATCASASQYDLKGRYGATSWKVYKGSNSCSASKECDFAIDENATTDKTVNINPCRLVEGQSCTETNQCLTGLTCEAGTCQGNSADLAIVEVIPIQVVPYVDMVKDKQGFIFVRIKNNGPKNATGVVNVTYEGSQLPIANYSNATAFIQYLDTITFNFTFEPGSAGSGKLIMANVSVVG